MFLTYLNVSRYKDRTYIYKIKKKRAIGHVKCDFYNEARVIKRPLKLFNSYQELVYWYTRAKNMDRKEIKHYGGIFFFSSKTS